MVKSFKDNSAVFRYLITYLPEKVTLYPYMSGSESFVFFCGAAGLNIGHNQAAALLAESSSKT